MDSAVAVLVQAIIVSGVLLVWVVLFAIIFRKAGYSGWLGLLMVVPVVNFIMLLFFATFRWPVEDNYIRVRKALSLENQGQWAAAIAEFERLAEQAGEEHASTARQRGKPVVLP